MSLQTQKLKQFELSSKSTNFSITILHEHQWV